jgi:S1-C subfamily serine protease
MDQRPTDPEQPANEAPNQPPNEAPDQPVNEAPDQPVNEAPNQPVNEAPNESPDEAWNQPTYGGENQPTYGGENQPTYGGENQPPNSWNQPTYAGGNQPPWGSPYPPWYPQPPRRRRRGPIAAALIAGTAAVAALGIGIGVATSGGTGLVLGQGSSANTAPAVIPPQASNPQQPSTTTGTSATATQSVGVVDINTVLQYQGAAGAGTGMILTSSGEVLTNNHVVDGATSIKVTVVSTGTTYTAKVVGTDPTADVAVVQLQGASGLQTAKIGSSSGVSAGNAVTAVGNAQGQGGTPIAVNGSVVATGQSLTASDASGANAETLTNMIEINANIVPGDSGGPLYDSSGNIIGMDTAASTSGGSLGSGGLGRYGVNGGTGTAANGSTAQTTAYAIPIDTAVSIAKQIESGQASSTITIGYPAFLGVSLQDSVNGPLVASVATGTPAAQAGLQAGDAITAVDGQAITSASSLSSIIGTHKPGDQIRLSWTDASGQSHTATVTLTTGPAN